MMIDLLLCLFGKMARLRKITLLEEKKTRERERTAKANTVGWLFHTHLKDEIANKFWIVGERK